MPRPHAKNRLQLALADKATQQFLQIIFVAYQIPMKIWNLILVTKVVEDRQWAIGWNCR